VYRTEWIDCILSSVFSLPTFIYILAPNRFFPRGNGFNYSTGNYQFTGKVQSRVVENGPCDSIFLPRFIVHGSLFYLTPSELLQFNPCKDFPSYRMYDYIAFFEEDFLFAIPIYRNNKTKQNTWKNSLFAPLF